MSDGEFFSLFNVLFSLLSVLYIFIHLIFSVLVHRLRNVFNIAELRWDVVGSLACLIFLQIRDQDRSLLWLFWLKSLKGGSIFYPLGSLVIVSFRLVGIQINASLLFFRQNPAQEGRIPRLIAECQSMFEYLVLVHNVYLGRSFSVGLFWYFLSLGKIGTFYLIESILTIMFSTRFFLIARIAMYMWKNIDPYISIIKLRVSDTCSLEYQGEAECRCYCTVLLKNRKFCWRSPWSESFIPLFCRKSY
jgi:hypothetical protein